jgi:hypothetical protein
MGRHVARRRGPLVGGQHVPVPHFAEQIIELGLHVVKWLTHMLASKGIEVNMIASKVVDFSNTFKPSV